jgi:hypothetical protein
MNDQYEDRVSSDPKMMREERSFGGDSHLRGKVMMAVVSRIKIMSNLKIDEQRIPQDGRCEVTTKDNREMDLRVSTLPTVNGEKIVMRIPMRFNCFKTTASTNRRLSFFAPVASGLTLLTNFEKFTSTTSFFVLGLFRNPRIFGKRKSKSREAGRMRCPARDFCPF